MEHILENMKPQCGAIVQSDGSVRWFVWAQNVDHVELVLIAGDTRTRHTMTREQQRYFSFVKDHVPNGPRCTYRLDGGPMGPDPANSYQPAALHPAADVLPHH